MKNAAIRENFRLYHDKTQTLAARAAALQEAQRLLQEAELSHDEKRKALRAALKSFTTLPDGTYIYRYIRAVYDAFLVYEEDDYSDENRVEKLFKREYSIDASGTVTFGEAIEVRVEYVAVETSTGDTQTLTESKAQSKPLRESYVSLQERAVRDDGTMLIKIIGPGKGSSGYYSREVIERDIPNVFPKGTHMMANHQTDTEKAEQPEGRIQNLAAEFVSNPYYLEESAAPDGEGAYVDAKPFADWEPMLEDKAEAIGVSIDGLGDISIGEIDGEVLPIVERITVGNTVDFVTRAGRDGKIVSLKEAHRLRESASRDASQITSTTPNESSQDNQENIVNEQEAAALRESSDKLKESNQRLQEALVMREAKDLAAKTLAAIEMPDMVRARLAESLSKNPATKVENDVCVLDAPAFELSVKEAATKELEFAQNAYGYGTGNVAGCGSAAPKESAPVLESVRSTRAQLGLS